MAIRVLIVDDSAVVRQLLDSMLSDVEDITVVGMAEDPYDAREKIKALNPDVITLDIEMPKMDGLTFLEKIMSLRPTPVVMVSTLTKKGATETLRALELGAIDYISKPTGRKTGDPLTWMKEELITKIRVAAEANLNSTDSSDESVALYKPKQGAIEPIIAIGSSTGGVEALREIFLRLPKNTPPIVITQHMPAQFTSSLAERLNKLSQMTVQEAQHGLRLQTGHAYIAPGGRHLTVAKQGSMFICRLGDGELVSGHKPSVDVLFESVEKAAGAEAAGIMLTGMGRDGADGMKKMHDAGAYTIAQNKSSCVVYGMPRAAVEAGAVNKEVSLHQIPSVLLSHLSNKE